MDDSPTNANLQGSFRINLAPGEHSFRLINHQTALDLRLTYQVRMDDPSKRLILNYETKQVIAR